MNTTTSTQGIAMDRMYAGQKHFFDVTRKFYLLGRDQLIDNVIVRPGASVCEIGTGTARNLIRLARRRRWGHYYGVDVSVEMLAQAAKSVARARLAGRITLHHALAEELRYRDLGLAAPFDTVFFSYCLSMIPANAVQPAIEAAWRNLATGGVLHYVDFGPMTEWPAPVRTALARWNALFHVYYRPEVIDALCALAPTSNVKLTPLHGGYALLVTVKKAGSDSNVPLG